MPSERCLILIRLYTLLNAEKKLFCQLINRTISPSERFVFKLAGLVFLFSLFSEQQSMPEGGVYLFRRIPIHKCACIEQTCAIYIRTCTCKFTVNAIRHAWTKGCEGFILAPRKFLTAEKSSSKNI